MVASATSASAHDELLASSPSPGERLAAAPTEVRLEFSADVLTIGAAVIVADASGRDWVVGEPQLEGGAVSVVLDEGMPAAGYEVRWRVVSSDGHPISGLVPFTVGEGEPLERPVAAETPAAEATTPGDSSDQSTRESDAVLRIALVGGGGAAVAALLFALIHFLRRRVARPRAGDSDAPIH